MSWRFQSTIDPGNVPVINARVDAAGYGGPRILTGNLSTTLDTANGFTRLDHGLSGAAQLSLRYNIVSGSDLEDAMAKRAAYETQMSKRDRRANASKEPATFPSATPLAT